MSIKIFYDQVKYRIRKAREIKRFLVKVISDENKKAGDLIFILTTDISLRAINKQFLKHDYCTDVISFNYSSDGNVNGEIYMSFDTIKRNSLTYKSGIEDEIIRVMIHGLLHLCGYNDENKEEKMIMFELQERKLQEFKERSE